MIINLCSVGKNRLTVKARIKGNTKTGNTFFKIITKSLKKEIDDTSQNKGNKRGIAIAATTLLMIVKVVCAASFPPSFPVITEAEAAVGVIKQIIAPSIKSTVIKLKSNTMSKTTNDPESTTCTTAKEKCQVFGIISFTSILQKERKSIKKRRNGKESHAK